MKIEKKVAYVETKSVGRLRLSMNRILRFIKLNEYNIGNPTVKFGTYIYTGLATGVDSLFSQHRLCGLFFVVVIYDA